MAFLAGELRQRQIGVGWATLRDAPGPGGPPSLTVTEVDAAFERIGRLAGPGSQTERRRQVTELFGRATAAEQRFLIGLLSGELRQGALEGVMIEAIARAAGVPGAEVRRAVMLRGALGPVAEVALASGVPGLRQFRLEVGRPSSRCWPRPRPASTRPWSGWGGRVEWSWTATASRSTGTGPRWPCSPGPSTTSPPGCPRWWRPPSPCRWARPCSTARSSPSSRTGGPTRSR